MKKLICCLAIIAIGKIPTFAQDGERIFKRFKGDVSFGYAAPVGSGSSGGILFAMEPKIAIIDKLSVGLRMEAAIMAKVSGSNYDGTLELEDGKAAASYVATADYYFTNNYSFRPFVGAGAGIFALVSDDDISDDATSGTKFGAIFRTGFEVKHFRFGIEYNMVGNREVYANTYDNLGQPAVTKYNQKNSYFGIKAGFCFGGGLR